MKYDIFHIVFCVVLFSIIFQGSLLPKVAEKCDMIDNSTDVMRTFSDYTGDMQIQFVQLPIGTIIRGKTVKSVRSRCFRVC